MSAENKVDNHKLKSKIGTTQVEILNRDQLISNSPALSGLEDFRQSLQARLADLDRFTCSQTYLKIVHHTSDGKLVSQERQAIVELMNIIGSRLETLMVPGARPPITEYHYQDIEYEFRHLPSKKVTIEAEAETKAESDEIQLGIDSDGGSND